MDLFIKKISLLLFVSIAITSFVSPNNPENWNKNPQVAFKNAVQESSLGVVKEIIKFIKEKSPEKLFKILSIACFTGPLN